MSRLCSVEGCGKKHQAKGFCRKHYARLLAHGDVSINKSWKGGIRKHRLYSAWAKMKSRCHNPKDSDYRLYGERGIVVTERWREFENFLKDMGERPEGCSLDRIDPNGPYAPWNCRWATHSEQRRNQSADGKRRQREGARRGALKRHGPDHQGSAPDV